MARQKQKNRRIKRQYLTNVLLLVVSLFSHQVLAQNRVVVVPLGGDDSPTFKTIFYTETEFTGNLGGLLGADDKCQIEADSAGVEGQFKAWLGTVLYQPLQSRPSFIQYDLPYRNVDGTPVADSFNDFLDGVFDGNIKSSSGDFILQAIWTGAFDSGFRSSLRCDEWTNEDSGTLGLVGVNNGGITPMNAWSGRTGTNLGCGENSALYCFEQ